MRKGELSSGVGVPCSYQRHWENSDGNPWHCPSSQGTQHKLIQTLGDENGQFTPSSGADFHEKIVVFLHIHSYSMGTQKTGTKLDKFSYKEAQTLEQF